MELRQLHHATIAMGMLMTLALPRSSQAQEIALRATADKTKLTVNERFQLTFTVDGSQDAPTPALPSLDGFAVLSGPTPYRQRRQMNRQVSESISYVYLLKPKAKGKFTIGPAELRYKRKTYRSKPIEIEVIDQPTTAGGMNLEKRLFAELVVDRPKPFVYEQVTLTFRIYIQRDLPLEEGSIRYQIPEPKGFLREKLGGWSAREEIRDGLIFTVNEFHQALFPVASGKKTIPAAQMTCNLLYRTKRRRRERFGFFDDWDPFGDRYRRVPLDRVTDPVELVVTSLPDAGKPESFTGAVGRFDLAVRVKPTKVRAGDPLTVTMTVSGEGHVEGIREPQLSSTEGFKVYEPEVISQTTPQGAKIVGRKAFSKVIEAQADDIQEVPAVAFTYFDPTLGAYQTVRRGPFAIQVLPRKEEKPIRIVPVVTEDGKEEVRIVGRDLLPIMTNVTKLSARRDFLYRQTWVLGSVCVPPFVILISLLLQRHRDRLQTDRGFARRRRAMKTAARGLGEAKRLMHSERQTDFYAALTKALQDYLGDKFDMPGASVSSRSIAERLGERSVAEDDVRALVDCMETCDMGRFSSASHTDREIRDTFHTARRLIRRLEKKL